MHVRATSSSTLSSFFFFRLTTAFFLSSPFSISQSKKTPEPPLLPHLRRRLEVPSRRQAHRGRRTLRPRARYGGRKFDRKKKRKKLEIDKGGRRRFSQPLLSSSEKKKKKKTPPHPTHPPTHPPPHTNSQGRHQAPGPQARPHPPLAVPGSAAVEARGIAAAPGGNRPGAAALGAQAHGGQKRREAAGEDCRVVRRSRDRAAERSCCCSWERLREL